jgi:hypothetical protein
MGVKPRAFQEGNGRGLDLDYGFGKGVSRDAQKLSVERELICETEAKLALPLPMANSSSEQEFSVVRMCHITSIEAQGFVDEHPAIFFHQQCSHEGCFESSCAVYLVFVGIQ